MNLNNKKKQKNIDKSIKNNQNISGITMDNSQAEFDTFLKENSSLDWDMNSLLPTQYGCNDSDEPLCCFTSTPIDECWDEPSELDNPEYWFEYHTYLAIEEYRLSIQADFEAFTEADYYEDCDCSEPTDNDPHTKDNNTYGATE